LKEDDFEKVNLKGDLFEKGMQRFLKEDIFDQGFLKENSFEKVYF